MSWGAADGYQLMGQADANAQSVQVSEIRENNALAALTGINLRLQSEVPGRGPENGESPRVVRRAGKRNLHTIGIRTASPSYRVEKPRMQNKKNIGQK